MSMAKLDERSNELVSKVTSEKIALAKLLKEVRLLMLVAKSRARIS